MSINFWKEKIVPYSWYPKNTTEHWSGSDLPLAKNPDWDLPIDYKFNAQGFRTHDLEFAFTNKVNVALGCSHTLGIGIPNEMTWPAQIEKLTGITTLNLGLGEGSSDTVARILTNIAGLLQIDTVYILWPIRYRFEYYGEKSIYPILPGNSQLEYVWYMEEGNSTQRLFRNKSIVYNLKNYYNFNIKEIHMGEPWAIPGDLARDQAHNGPKSNLNLANLFLTGVK